jgi:hypothetical protein
VRAAVDRFEAERGRVRGAECRENAMRFAPEHFRAGLTSAAEALLGRGLAVGRPPA